MLLAPPPAPRTRPTVDLPVPVGGGDAGAFTAADLGERFGDLPAWRIRRRPAPGTATAADAERARAAGFLCELVDGTLVEKVVSEETGITAARLIMILGTFVDEHDLGWVGGPDVFVRLYGGTLERAPDVSYIAAEQRPNGLATVGCSEGAPFLCVEVFSPSNTLAEVRRKRREYFGNGCRMVIVLFATEAPPGRANTAEVYLPGDPDTPARVVRDGDDLAGDPVLPGFSVPLARVLRRGGGRTGGPAA